MTLLTSLPTALAGAVNFALTEFGTACYLRRRVEAEVVESDGSTSLDAAMVGDDTPIQVVIDSPSQAALQQKWGSATEATARGIAKLDAGLLAGDFLIPNAGDFDGVWFEIVERQPTDAANVVEIGMKQVPPQSAGDPLV